MRFDPEKMAVYRLVRDKQHQIVALLTTTVRALEKEAEQEERSE